MNTTLVRTRPLDGIRVCDVGDCPARAQTRLDIFEQDFYFCDHHAAEVAAALPVQRVTREPSADAMVRSQAAPVAS